MDVVKKSDYEIEVSESIPRKRVWTFDSLSARKKALSAQLVKTTKEMNTELAQIDALLAECAQKGVVSKLAELAAQIENV